MKKTLLICLGGIAAVFLSASVFGADWPMWRCDASRSGCSPENLAAELNLQWVRELPRTVRAWPNETRLRFDECYEPIVMGKLLYVVSPNDGSLTAYDTRTGAQKWKYYTEGPIRFAPVAVKDKIYVGSDDGVLYCLDAATGSVRWKFRAAPAARPDLHHLGNARLVSFWPVRGGPVFADGKILVASGLWPTLGVFLYALDPETGKVVWSNEQLNLVEEVRTDHDKLCMAGLSPQGYLAAQQERLFVPNGRALPAGVELKTGQLLYYLQGTRNGHSRVTVEGKYVFVGETGVMDIESGREMGSYRFIKDDRKYNAVLGESPHLPYKTIPGCDAWSVFASNTAYGNQDGIFYAYDLRNPTLAPYDHKFQGKLLKPNKWEVPLLWKVDIGRKSDARALIRAGNRLYGIAGDSLVAVDLAVGEAAPKIVWQKTVTGTPASLLAADGRLFVVTLEGNILCYGQEAASLAQTFKLAAAALPELKDEYTERAAAILKATWTSEGYCVVLGLNSGRLVEELLKQSKMKIIGVDADREKINALREKFMAAGVYGIRVELFSADPFGFSLPPYIANLILSEKFSGSEFMEKMPAEKVFEPLHPYGGAACFDLPAQKQDAFQTWSAKVSLPKAELAREGSFALLRRVGALPGSAPWTHESADAARTHFSRDQNVKIPLAVLWYGDGPDHGFARRNDYDTEVKPQVANGCLVALQIEKAGSILYSVDIYTGRLLWTKNVEQSTHYVTMEDGLYVAQGGACTVFDPLSGAVKKEFAFQASALSSKIFVSDMRVAGDVIAIGANLGKPSSMWDFTMLIGLDRESGKQLWTLAAKERFNNRGFAMADDLVFLADSPTPGPLRMDMKSNTSPSTNDVPSVFMALEARTGKVKWKTEFSIPYTTFRHLLYLRNWDDWVAYSAECKILLAGKNNNVFAFDPQTGNQLWKKNITLGAPMILKGEVFYTQGGSPFSIRTGEKAKLPQIQLISGPNCNYGVGGENLFFIRRQYATMLDVQTGKSYQMRNIRSGCSISLVAADGVLSAPNFMSRCICNYPLQTAYALVHLPVTAGWEGELSTRQVVKGE